MFKPVQLKFDVVEANAKRLLILYYIEKESKPFILKQV